MDHKFRCWDEDHYVYSTDEPSNPPNDGESWFGFEDGILKAWVSTTETPGDVYEPPYPSSEELENPIEQYIGPKDKKRTKEFPDGQPIYEGDICKNGDWVEDAHAYCYRTEEVRYCQQEGAYHGWNHNEDGMTCEVIGNIHENPELLP